MKVSLSGIIDWCDDRLNPIVVKELRQAVKSRMVVAILILFLGLQLFLLGFYLMVREVRGEASMIDWSAGNDVFRIQQGILLWTIMILVPAYAAIRLASERSDQNVDLMFISTLRPASIIWGKFFAALVLGLLIFSACAPFMTFCYLLRGIDIPTILTVLGIDLLCMLFGITVALFLASIPGGRPLKFFICFIGFVQLAWVCAMMTGATIAIIMEGEFFEWLYEYWYVAGAMVAAMLALCGLLFFYCVAMISPPSANRIMPLRVYLFAAWLVTGITVFLVSYHLPGGLSPIPTFFFLILMTPILGVQLWISISERDRWAPRVARTIPRLLVLRIPAFLFYTGAAGGISYSVLLYALTFGVTGWWYDQFAGAGRVWEFAYTLLAGMVQIALYVYCYGMSAVLVRQYLLANQIKASFTWLIAGLLVGLGSSIPLVIAYIAFYDQLRYATEPGWWALTNPFLSIAEVLWEVGRLRNEEFRILLFWFLGTWSVLVTMLAFPWFMGQVRRFRPPAKRENEPAQVIVLEQSTATVGAG